jgi:hypothetical protein
MVLVEVVAVVQIMVFLYMVEQEVCTLVEVAAVDRIMK